MTEVKVFEYCMNCGGWETKSDKDGNAVECAGCAQTIRTYPPLFQRQKGAKMTEFKECPFCGKKPTVHNYNGEGWYIRCCDILFEPYRRSKTHEELSIKWNTRTCPTCADLKKRVEELEGVIFEIAHEAHVMGRIYNCRGEIELPVGVIKSLKLMIKQKLTKITGGNEDEDNR